MNNIDKAKKVLALFRKHYKNLKPFLKFNNIFELLIVTILSAQTRDERVNAICDKLFSMYPTPEHLAEADINTLQTLLHPLGFYKTKAKNIVLASKYLVENFKSRVPKDIEDLIKIPGVGRKTANCVISYGFGKPGIIVDTHVKRVNIRLGIINEIKAKDATYIEYTLKQLLPKQHWSFYSLACIYHGKTVCKARAALCYNCFLTKLCNYYKKIHIV